jgi:hypothetical protein
MVEMGVHIEEATNGTSVGREEPIMRERSGRLGGLVRINRDNDAVSIRPQQVFEGASDVVVYQKIVVLIVVLAG